MILLSSGGGMLNSAILHDISADQQIAQGRIGYDIGIVRRGSISGSVGSSGVCQFDRSAPLQLFEKVK
jgi:hypothetical protein